MRFFRKNSVKSVEVKQHIEMPREYYYLGEGIAQLRLKSGHFIHVDPMDESVCAHLIAFGEWEPWILGVVRKLLRPGDHVVEVGGHVGYYTLAMADKVGDTGSILTFEANPRLAQLAQRSVLFNGYAKRVRIEQKAASNSGGILRFMLSRRFSGGGHLFLRTGLLSVDAEVIEVESVRLDDLELPQIRLLRMDAEGSEGLILEGASKLLETEDLIICMEWDRIQMRSRSKPEDLIKNLADRGFRFWYITMEGRVEPVAPSAMMDIPHCDIIVSRVDVVELMASDAAA